MNLLLAHNSSNEPTKGDRCHDGVPQSKKNKANVKNIAKKLVLELAT